MDKFMAEAIKEAEIGIGAGHGGPFGAVVVRDGMIVGRGHNEVLKRQSATCHAEIMAINDASANLKTFDLSGCDLYCTSEPCPMCLCAAMWANLRKNYYGCTRQDTGAIGFRDDFFYEIMHIDHTKLNLLEQIDRKECLELFDRYTKMKHELY